MQVDRITSADVMAVTAGRVRQRIGAVMRWAIAQGHRADNPAGDAITAALPRNGRQSRHFKALPHGDVAKALATVRGSTASDGVRLSFEFIVLTAARSGEVRGALWEEIDEEAGVWRVPGSRTKTGRSHRVPLSRRALQVLDEARESLGGDPIFRAARSRRRPLATGAWRGGSGLFGAPPEGQEDSACFLEAAPRCEGRLLAGAESSFDGGEGVGVVGRERGKGSARRV